MNRHRLPFRSIRIIILITGLAFGTVVGLSRPAPAGAVGAQLAFSPASASVGVSGTVNVDITVASVTDLGGYDLALQFNPALVHLVSLTDSGFVTSPPSGNLVTCVAATINNSTGTATETCLTLASSSLGTPVPGTGVSAVGATALVHAQFTGVATGVASLTLTGSTLQGPTGTNIPVTLGTGSITVTPTASVGGIAEQPDLAALRSGNVPASGVGRAGALAGAARVAAAFALGGACLVGRRNDAHVYSLTFAIGALAEDQPWALTTCRSREESQVSPQRREARFSDRVSSRSESSLAIATSTGTPRAREPPQPERIAGPGGQSPGMR